MLKKIFSIFISVFILLNISACSSKDKSTIKTSENKINVVVSFNPMKELTEAIAKDKAKITVMIPKGVEAHDFEPKPKDMAALNDCKIFIYNGLGMEPWAENALKTINNSNLITVEASKGCNLIENKKEEEIKEHGQYDPHLWLSLKEAKVEANNIKEALIKADSENKDFYEKNFKEFSDNLDKLQNEYENKFKEIKNRNFVTGHAAFAYLCRDFKLEQNSVEDVFAEGEATTAKMKELVDYCKENNIKTIFMEEMASPKVSETIAKEVGGKIEVINTLESEGNYIETMKENYDKIYNSLK